MKTSFFSPKTNKQANKQASKQTNKQANKQTKTGNNTRSKDAIHFAKEYEISLKVRN
jgi:hypothetical protein